MQNNLVRGPPKKSTDHEQQNFITICLSIRYKSGLFAVLCPALNKAALVTIDGAALVTIDGAADGVKDLVQSIVIPSGFLSS